MSTAEHRAPKARGARTERRRREPGRRTSGHTETGKIRLSASRLAPSALGARPRSYELAPYFQFRLYRNRKYRNRKYKLSQYSFFRSYETGSRTWRHISTSGHTKTGSTTPRLPPSAVGPRTSRLRRSVLGARPAPRVNLLGAFGASPTAFGGRPRTSRLRRSVLGRRPTCPPYSRLGHLRRRCNLGRLLRGA